MGRAIHLTILPRTYRRQDPDGLTAQSSFPLRVIRDSTDKLFFIRYRPTFRWWQVSEWRSEYAGRQWIFEWQGSEVFFCVMKLPRNAEHAPMSDRKDCEDPDESFAPSLDIATHGTCDSPHNPTAYVSTPRPRWLDSPEQHSAACYPGFQPVPWPSDGTLCRLTRTTRIQSLHASLEHTESGGTSHTTKT